MGNVLKPSPAHPVEPIEPLMDSFLGWVEVEIQLIKESLYFFKKKKKKSVELSGSTNESANRNSFHETKETRPHS